MSTNEEYRSAGRLLKSLAVMLIATDFMVLYEHEKKTETMKLAVTISIALTTYVLCTGVALAHGRNAVTQNEHLWRRILIWGSALFLFGGITLFILALCSTAHRVL